VPPLSRGEVGGIVADPAEDGACVVSEVDCPGLRCPGLDLAVGSVVRHDDVEDVREPCRVDAVGVLHNRGGPYRGVPDQGVFGESDEREPLAPETGGFPDIVEEGAGEDDIGIHRRPPDASRQCNRVLRGLKGVLGKPAGAGVVAPFRCRGFEEPRRLLKNPADERGDAGVADHRGHACQPLADGGGVYGGVDEEGGLDPLQRQRFCRIHNEWCVDREKMPSLTLTSHVPL